MWDKMHVGMSLTERDIEFLKDHFRHACRDENAFYFLLADPASLDRLLEDDSLHQRLLDAPRTLSISPRFYFIVLLKRAFRDAGLNQPELVSFLALALEERTSESGSSADTLVAGNGFYTVDVLEKLSASGDAYRNFKLLVSVGNHLLFLTGLFPDFVKHRENRRGAPGLRYYEDFGRSSYLNASRHPVADEFDLRPICACLAEHFCKTRRVLNDVAEKILFLN